MEKVAHMLGISGFWGQPTSLSPSTEVPYYYSFFISEFFNTISASSFITAGLFGIILSLMPRTNYNFHSRLGFVAMILAGFGATMFHATMKRTTEVFANIFEAWAGILVLYSLMTLRNHADAQYCYRTATFLIGYAAAFPVTALLSSTLYGLLSFSLIFVFAGIFWNSLLTITDKTTDKMSINMLLLSWGIMLGSAGLFWLPQRVFGMMLQPLHLQALFHLGACASAFIFSLFNTYELNRRLGHDVKFGRSGTLFPFVYKTVTPSTSTTTTTTTTTTKVSPGVGVVPLQHVKKVEKVQMKEA